MATPGPAILLSDIFIPTLTGYSYNDGTSGYIQLDDASLQLTSTTAQEDSVKETWTTYLEEVKAHDERRANSWTEDANSTIIFVSLKSHSNNPMNPRNDKPEGQSIFHNRCRLYH
jgi:hypothetical protein